jgi:hypothetical protein
MRLDGLPPLFFRCLRRLAGGIDSLRPQQSREAANGRLGAGPCHQLPTRSCRICHLPSRLPSCSTLLLDVLRLADL